MLPLPHHHNSHPRGSNYNVLGDDVHTKENTDERKEKEMKNAAVVLNSIGEECSGRGLCFKHAVSFQIN